MSEAKNPFERVEVAESYDEWYENPIGRKADRLECALIYEMAAPKAGESCLEVGAGTGHIAQYLVQRGLSVIGLDRSEAMLHVARRRVKGDILWHLGDAQCLPYDSEVFDLSLSVTTLEFVQDPDRMLAEMYRVVKPGGRMVVATINRASSWGRMYRKEAERRETPFSEASFFTAPELVEALERFGPVRWSSAVFFPPSGRWLVLAPILEQLGKTFCRERGALLVARVDK